MNDLTNSSSDHFHNDQNPRNPARNQDILPYLNLIDFLDTADTETQCLFGTPTVENMVPSYPLPCPPPPLYDAPFCEPLGMSPTSSSPTPRTVASSCV